MFSDRLLKPKLDAFLKEFEAKQAQAMDKQKSQMFEKIDKVGKDYEAAIDHHVREIVYEILKSEGLLPILPDEGVSYPLEPGD